MPLEGKLVLVTGGGHGLGRAIALGLARAKANIVIFGHSQSDTEETAQRIRAETTCRVIARSGDVSKRSDIEELARTVENDIGPVSVIINNAAGWFDGIFTDVGDNAIDLAIDTTVKGSIIVCQEFWHQLTKHKRSHVINITTLGARESRSNASPVYVASKYGLYGFTDAFRRYAIHHGVLVTEILPGSIASDVDIDSPVESLISQRGDSVCHPRDIVAAVLFALSLTQTSMIEEIRIPAVGDWKVDYSRYPGN